MEFKHKKQNECDIEFLRKNYVATGIVKIYFCKTHNVETCRCGIEWGKHAQFYDSLRINK